MITKPIACVAKDRNARITARIEGPIKSARVVFRSVDPKCDEYYVEMRQSPNDPTLYSAILPLVDAGTRTISYQVRVEPANGGAPIYSPAEPLTANVRDGCAADPLSETEQRTANNLTLGLTSSGQTGAPCAFRCNGITSILTVANELRPNTECFRRLAATPWYLSQHAREIGGTAAVLGGMYLLHRHLREDDTPPSPARP